jgi:electron transport complex protein RnfC
MKVYSFPKGGISFEDSFAPSRNASVLSFLPQISIIPMRSYSGVSAFPVAQVGSHVEEGMLIARGQGSGSANIHAPIPGKVLQTLNWKLADGFYSDALAIGLEGKFDILGCPENAQDWRELPQFEIRKRIVQNGITEMDGEGRPLCDVFSQFDAAQTPFTLLVRCVFDDPWLAADYCLCRERLANVAQGCLIAAKATGAARIAIAVSKDEIDLARELAAKIAANVSIVAVRSRYPQHSFRELENVFRANEKTEKTSYGPLMIVGPATLDALADAVILNKPVLDRYVAVGGSAVAHPKVLKARIGSRISDLFNECGGFVCEPARLAIGSPLLGRMVESLNEPILKTSYAVFAIAGNKSSRIAKKLRNLFNISESKNELSCLGCGDCRRVCPAGLDPEDIYKRKRDNKHEIAMIPLVMKCYGCGCCESVCPAKLPLCNAIVKSAYYGRDDGGDNGGDAGER